MWDTKLSYFENCPTNSKIFDFPGTTSVHKSCGPNPWNRGGKKSLYIQNIPLRVINHLLHDLTTSAFYSYSSMSCLAKSAKNPTVWRFQGKDIFSATALLANQPKLPHGGSCGMAPHCPSSSSWSIRRQQHSHMVKREDPGGQNMGKIWRSRRSKAMWQWDLVDSD